MFNFLLSWFNPSPNFSDLISDLLKLIHRPINYQHFHFSNSYHINFDQQFNLHDLRLIIQRLLGNMWSVKILSEDTNLVRVELETGRKKDIKVVPLSQ